MVTTRKPVLFKTILLIMLTAVVGCNESPKQYSSELPNMGKNSEDVIIKTSYDSDAFSIKRPGEDVADEDEQIRQNSLKEIVYGFGAGGIDLNTTLEQSRKLLSKPEVEVVEGNNIKTYYNSGMYIVWRSEEPQVPLVIWLDNNYQGTLKAEGNIGNIKIGSDLSKHYNDQSVRGEEFITELFNLMENKDEGYNCLEEKRCEILEHPKYFLYNLKKFIVLVTKDRKIIVDMRIVRKDSLDDIDPSFDVISGDFLIDDQTRVKLGQQWSDVRETIGQDGLTNIFLDGFSKDFGSLGFILTKSSFDRSYTNPDDNELVRITSVNSGFLKPLLFDGKYLDMTTMMLVDTPNNDVLTLETTVDSENINDTIIKVEALVKEALVKKFSDHLVISRVDNLQSRNYMKNINLNFMVVDEKTGSGRMVSIGYSTIKNKFSYVQNSLLVSKELNKLAISNISKGIDAKNTKVLDSINGITIGDRVTLSNIDLARDQVSYQLIKGTKTISGTSLYMKSNSLDLILDESGRSHSFELEAIKIGDLDTVLFLKEVSGEEATHKVVAILSKEFQGPISNLCGSTKLSFQDKERDTESLAKVLEFKSKEFEKVDSCPIHINKIADGSGFISRITFPELRLLLDFGKRELSGVLIFANPKEVQ